MDDFGLVYVLSFIMNFYGLVTKPILLFLTCSAINCRKCAAR